MQVLDFWFSACRYTEAAGNLQEETFASKARLILHFDVNKSIIMTDKAQASSSPPLYYSSLLRSHQLLRFNNQTFERYVES